MRVSSVDGAGGARVGQRSVRDQVVVIVGACCGVGLAAGHELARAGARVVLAGCPWVAAVASEIGASGGEAVHCVADPRQLDDAQRAARLALDFYERIDAWVNVVEPHAPSRVSEESTGVAPRHWGLVNGSLVAFWNMKDAGGTIINVCADPPDSAESRAAAHFTQVLQAGVRRMSTPIALSLVETHGAEPREVAAAVAATITRSREPSSRREVA